MCYTPASGSPSPSFAPSQPNTDFWIRGRIGNRFWDSGRIGNLPCLPSPRGRGAGGEVLGKNGNRIWDSGRIGNRLPPPPSASSRTLSGRCLLRPLPCGAHHPPL